MFSVTLGDYESASSLVFTYYIISVYTWVSAIITGHVSFISFLRLNFSEIVMFLEIVIFSVTLGYCEVASSLAFTFHAVEQRHEFGCMYAVQYSSRFYCLSYDEAMSGEVSKIFFSTVYCARVICNGLVWKGFSSFFSFVGHAFCAEDFKVRHSLVETGFWDHECTWLMILRSLFVLKQDTDAEPQKRCRMTRVECLTRWTVFHMQWYWVANLYVKQHGRSLTMPLLRKIAVIFMLHGTAKLHSYFK